MNRQEVLHGLNKAVTLFKQQEALSQEYDRVQQKDRPYEEKQKIGWLGIIVLGFEIYYVGAAFLGVLGALFSNDAEEVVGCGAFCLIGLGVLITTYFLFRMHNMKRNKWVDKENIKIKELKKAIEIRKKEIKGEYAEVQKRIDRYLGDWYPEGYEKSYIAAYFYQVLENGRARTLGDAINLYEEECYRRRQSEENAQILNELERQSFKQNVQIAQSMAETAALSAQLATANKQLADMKKELAELKRGDANRR
ncbi:MAG: hypothetical protein IJ419_10225 [Agathobacter sp.]|nr:hypothetical protein [Agathobacter sp.]